MGRLALIAGGILPYRPEAAFAEAAFVRVPDFGGMDIVAVSADRVRGAVVIVVD